MMNCALLLATVTSIAERADAQVVDSAGLGAGGPVAARLVPARVVALTLGSVEAWRAGAALQFRATFRNN